MDQQCYRIICYHYPICKYPYCRVSRNTLATLGYDIKLARRYWMVHSRIYVEGPSINLAEWSDRCITLFRNFKMDLGTLKELLFMQFFGLLTSYLLAQKTCILGWMHV